MEVSLSLSLCVCVCVCVFLTERSAACVSEQGHVEQRAVPHIHVRLP